MQEMLVLTPGSGRAAGEGIGYPLQYSWASLVAQLVKNPPAMREPWVRSLGWEDPLEKGTAATAAKSLQSCPTLCDPMDRPEYWSGEPFPSPGDLPNPGIEPRSPVLQVDSLPADPQGKPENSLRKKLAKK